MEELISEKLDEIIYFLDNCGTEDDMSDLHAKVKDCVDLVVGLDKDAAKGFAEKVDYVRSKIAILSGNLSDHQKELASKIDSLQNFHKAKNLYSKYKGKN